MAYNETLYTENSVNTGLQKGCSTTGAISKILIAPAGTSFADFDSATDFATFESALNAIKTDRIFILPRVFEPTDETEEPIIETSGTGQVLNVRDEREMYTFSLEPVSMYNYLQLRKFNGCGNYSFAFVYQNGQIGAQSSDGVKFEFRPLQYLNINKLRNTDGTVLAKPMLKLVVADGDLFHSKGVLIAPLTNEVAPWNPNTDLFGIKDVKMEVISASTTTAVVKVTGFADNIPVEGLVFGDFLVKKAEVGVTVTVAVESEPGVYTLTYVTTAGAHTFGLKNQPDMTTKYFETPERTAFTIV